MAAKCEICGKLAATGNSVSHANNKTKRRFRPNLQTTRREIAGKVKTIRVCTRCLRTLAKQAA